LDFDNYKNRFLEYLRLRGINARSGDLIHCISPDHEDHDPSCQVSDEGFFCHSGNCGIHGDIYDAIGILEGIIDRKEQYLFAEKLFGGGSVSLRTQKKRVSENDDYEKEHEKDPAAEGLFEAYLKRNPASEKEIRRFLSIRAANSSFGFSHDYPAEMFPELVKYFFYWPGYDIAWQEINRETLRRCRVPGKKRETNISSWDHTGLVVKLGYGYKLLYYQDGICQKRGTLKCEPFPMPGELDLNKPIILVEAEMNAVSCSAIGIKNVFATGGTNGLTKPLIKKYLLEAKELIIFFDADPAGRIMSGLDPIKKEGKGVKTNLPAKLRQAGYKGIIKVAELPPVAESGGKDQDALIITGKKKIVLDALENAREYTEPEPEKKPSGSLWEAYDAISIKRMRSLLSKIKKNDLDDIDVNPFISACVKSCKHSETRQELAKWGATPEELEIKDDTSPYFLIEACGKYGVSKYIKNEIEKALVPASEILKRIKNQQTIVDIDFDKMAKNENALQFITTKGVHSAALMIADILDNKMVYVESEKRHYFFNGHTWQREPDMPNIAYNFLCSMMRYFLENHIGNKSTLFEIMTKIEGRKFRVEVSQDFSGLPQVFNESILFDGPTVRETLTLADGVIDFSGSEIIYRKSKREEYRREMLPYKVNDIKNAGTPEKFLEFMKGNFKDEKTLETLLYYISLIPSRNTQYKYGGIWVGKTHTGKTTTVELLSYIYEGMFTRINADILVTRDKRRASGNEATPYIARLEGKGLGVAQETERNGILNNALWKDLTGGDTLTARGLYQMPHDFVPTAQILVCTNHQPRFDAHDDATIDRMIVIPFSVQHEKGKEGTIQQTAIYSKLRPEYPAVVKFFSEYYIRLRNEFDGLIPLSAECANYKQNYVKEMETDLDKFVNDNLEIDMSGNAFEKVQDVYDRYLQYYDIKADDKQAITRNKFVRYIKSDWIEINYKQKKINGEPVLCFFNVRLKPLSGKTEEPGAGGGKIINDNRREPPEDEMPF
jgi:phage/plasmid-associated DNA primase/5S rRNA maturation endonuclease (ribonuclease M5)